MTDTKKENQRRALLRNLLLGAAGAGVYESFSSIGLSNKLMSDLFRTPDNNAFKNGLGFLENASLSIQDALSGGSALLGVHKVFAQAKPNKLAMMDVFIHISSDPRMTLNLTGLSANNNIFNSINHGGATNLGGLNQDAVSAGLKNSRINRFFEGLILTGKYDGGPENGTLPGFTMHTKAIDPTKISIVSFLSNQVEAGAHGPGASSGFGSVTYGVQANSKMSPMGIAAFGDDAHSVLDTSGRKSQGGRSSVAFLQGLKQSTSSGYVSDSLDPSKNLSIILDEMAKNEDITKIRSGLLESQVALKGMVSAWQTSYANLGGATFNPLVGGMGGGPINAKRAAAMSLSGEMAKSGLVTLSSVGLNTFDFHATDGNRAPAGETGNMVTSTVEIGVGINAWANRLIEAQMDGVAFVRASSNRSEDWVQDTNSTFSLMIVVKGGSSPEIAKIVSDSVLPMDRGGFIGSAPRASSAGVFGDNPGVVGQGSVEATVANVVVKAVTGTGLPEMSNRKIGVLKTT